ncbi:response regulator [Sphingomonas bacterium]|uniref:response regulator n=1 Tax=Sphingomonas bacterium TaxID=1895847 RepID=UPI00260C385C|nr:response regulator [Sphingomonas bacterium]MDB5679746.1 response regulator [Sphingomonas bacterium]
MTIHALLVDDDPDTRAIVALALGLHRRFAVTAVSRLDAADMLRRGFEQFDVILLDMKMSDMSAGALVATIRQWSREPVPILLLSAKAGDADRRSYRSAGAHGVIAKPFDPVALPDRIADMLEPGSMAHGRAVGSAR